MSKRKIKPASAAPARPAWRYTSAHLPVSGGRAVVFSHGAAYGWKVPNRLCASGYGAETSYEPSFEAACRAAARALPDAERRRDPEWVYTGAIMELSGAAYRRLSVSQVGDGYVWRACNEGRTATSGDEDSMSRAQHAAEQWALENGWMCPDCGGPMHQCKTGDAGCFHCNNDKCGGAVAPRRGE